MKLCVTGEGWACWLPVGESRAPCKNNSGDHFNWWGTAHCTQNTAHCTLHTAHCTLHTAHCTLNTSHYTLQTAQCTTIRTMKCCSVPHTTECHAVVLGSVKRCLVHKTVHSGQYTEHCIGNSTQYIVHWSDCAKQINTEQCN